MAKRIWSVLLVLGLIGMGAGLYAAEAAKPLPPGVPAGAVLDPTDGSYRLKIDQLPPAVRAQFEKQAAGNSIRAISVEIIDGKPVFDCDVFEGSKKHEVVTDAEGNLKSAPLNLAKAAEPAKTAATPTAAATATAAATDVKFQESFDVDKATLADKGRAKYFILEPGYKLTFKNGIDTLIITVTEETKVVDGVKCRIIEERETKTGKLEEVSRNYFALDPKTGDVYYFGETVDMYDTTTGKVKGHEGSWESGKDGAKFGLMIPGRPMIGMRYNQEVAPKVAMDRAEIVSTTDEIKVPAGIFKNCVRTKESSALEEGYEEKVYAPDVGLVKDAEFELAEIEKAKIEPPAAVTKAFQEAFPKAEIEKLDIDNENGVMVYDYEFREGTVEKECDIAADGTIMEKTLVIEAKDLPAVVAKAIEKGSEGGKLGRIERIDITHESKDGKVVKLAKPIVHYSAEWTKGETSGEVTVDAEGNTAE
jgi:uncharacterized membrane protein YkoI